MTSKQFKEKAGMLTNQPLEESRFNMQNARLGADHLLRIKHLVDININCVWYGYLKMTIAFEKCPNEEQLMMLAINDWIDNSNNTFTVNYQHQINRFEIGFG